MTKDFLYRFFTEKFRAHDKELKLQAKEYKRRLADLNHEAEQLKDMQATYTPREIFDRTVDDLKEKIDILILWKTKQEGKSQLIQYIPWILSIIFAILAWYKK